MSSWKSGTDERNGCQGTDMHADLQTQVEGDVWLPVMKMVLIKRVDTWKGKGEIQNILILKNYLKVSF